MYENPGGWGGGARPLATDAYGHERAEINFLQTNASRCTLFRNIVSFIDLFCLSTYFLPVYLSLHLCPSFTYIEYYYY